jgi:3-deoxy-D-manno-octulosonic-acid transferase
MRFRPLVRLVLGLFSHFNMQTQVDADRITGLGASPENVSIVGNVKFDQAYASLKNMSKDLPTRSSLGFDDMTLVMIGGSTHPGEEAEMITAFRSVLKEKPEAALVLVPRHPERFEEVASLLEREGVRFKRRSTNKGASISAGEALLVDTMGELAGMYRVADIVFVGGSWANVGGHNILEPAAFGKPVFFGPNMHNFDEIASIMKDSGVGIQVKDGAALAKEALRLIDNPDRLEKLGKMAKSTLHNNRGALESNAALIEMYL